MPKNQCDGCARGLPIHNGIHRGDGYDMIGCTKDLYIPERKTYRHLYVRVNYPFENGYRIEPYQLPDWMSVEICEQDESKRVIVRSGIHLNKKVTLGHSYSMSWKDEEILKDISAEIRYRWDC